MTEFHDEPSEQFRITEEAKARGFAVWKASIEDACYNTFKTVDGRIVLDFLREQLGADDADLTLQDRGNPTINAQRDAMKIVYWALRGLAERGARRKGDSLEAR